MATLERAGYDPALRADPRLAGGALHGRRDRHRPRRPQHAAGPLRRRRVRLHRRPRRQPARLELAARMPRLRSPRRARSARRDRAAPVRRAARAGRRAAGDARDPPCTLGGGRGDPHRRRARAPARPPGAAAPPRRRERARPAREPRRRTSAPTTRPRTRPSRATSSSVPGASPCSSRGADRGRARPRRPQPPSRRTSARATARPTASSPPTRVAAPSCCSRSRASSAGSAPRAPSSRRSIPTSTSSLLADGRRRVIERAGAARRARRPGARGAHRRADGPQPARPPLRDRDAHAPVTSPPSRARARRSSTPARRRPACARSRSTRCAAAAARTTAPASTTRSSSRRTTCGSPAGSLPRSRALRNGLPIEVEAETLADVAEALEAGVDRILLDNMSPAEVARGGRARRRSRAARGLRRDHARERPRLRRDGRRLHLDRSADALGALAPRLPGGRVTAVDVEDSARGDPRARARARRRDPRPQLPGAVGAGRGRLRRRLARPLAPGGGHRRVGDRLLRRPLHGRDGGDPLARRRRC